MVLIASVANNLDVISTIVMFKVVAMFPNSRCVGSIVFQRVASLGKITLQVKKKLQSTFKELCPGMKLKIVLSSPNRLRSGFVFKDRLPREMDSMLLYKFTCSACNCTYIGETKRHFQVRSYEHMGISLLTDKLFKYNVANATAVRKHCNDLEHNNNIDDIQIVGHASNKFDLRLKESLLISMVNPTIINVQKKSMPLYVFGR